MLNSCTFWATKFWCTSTVRWKGKLFQRKPYPCDICEAINHTPCSCFIRKQRLLALIRLSLVITACDLLSQSQTSFSPPLLPCCPDITLHKHQGLEGYNPCHCCLFPIFSSLYRWKYFLCPFWSPLPPYENWLGAFSWSKATQQRCCVHVLVQTHMHVQGYRTEMRKVTGRMKPLMVGKCILECGRTCDSLSNGLSIS